MVSVEPITLSSNKYVALMDVMLFEGFGHERIAHSALCVCVYVFPSVGYIGRCARPIRNPLCGLKFQSQRINKLGSGHLKAVTRLRSTGPRAATSSKGGSK